ncbi:MAG TPA: carboxypeptidase regulatory-like domain-containing protein [Thermoanaerobaculia bacterium]|nr:carboxypeptidase regulatory-like domain-containing protein [Thermoanaerobaculia bacterium]
MTTGSLTGVVKAADGSALPGVTIEAVHTPTGTRYSDVTGVDGRYNIPNVRVGGPYTVTASLEGFKPTTAKNLDVILGTPTEVPLTLQLSTVSESITVTATADDIINPNKTGSSSEVSEEAIETLPTVNRSLQDFARTNPYFVVDAQDFSATRVTVAGRNNRYNSIQIDGAVNNDLFGLADTGTPGGQTDAQPISLDAIQQLQLVVSPYDVRQGGFTGGGMNAVTRSGTNKFTGSIFGGRRSPDLVGDGPYEQPVGDFTQDQWGGRLGGPIFRDKLFFFVSGEMNRKKSPTNISTLNPGTPGNTTADVAAGALRLSNFLKSKYNYDPGTLGDFSAATDSDLAFGRIDWNVNNSNQLTLRHNYVKAGRDVFGGRTETRWTFDTATYTQADETNSTVAQLNSVFTANAYNEARVSFQTIKDAREVPVVFPSVEIGATARNGTWTAGTERFSGANSLDQDILELTDDFTLVAGNHTVTIGTHNEFFTFKNLFLSEAFGYYFFPTMDQWETGQLACVGTVCPEYRVSFATGSDPRRPTTFDAGQYGLYANDSWRANNQLTFTFGLRVDKPTFPDAPSFNQQVQTLIRRDTSNTASERPVFSPRIGFNWQPTAGGNQQVRGGIGIFAGRTPYVWISNAYANTGVESVALSCVMTTNPATSCTPPAFNANVDQQPKTLGSGGSLSVDLIDPDFNFPRVMRATLGYDRNLFWGIRGSAEVLMSKTMEDVFYYNVNREATGTVSPLDGRPMFKRVNNGIADAILLSNTGAGEETTFTLQLNRPFANGLVLGANYAHQDANSSFDATSSRAISNWQFRHTKGNIFAHDVSRSAFEIEHRINLSASYNFATGPLSHTVGLYYNMQSGRPYSIMMGGDPNGDGFSTNDLLYVPSPDKVIYEYSNGSRAASPDGVTPAQAFANFMSFLGVSPTEGRILDRYEFTEPWVRQLDVHYAIELPVTFLRTEVSFDINNALALFDKNAGITKFVSNQNFTVLNYRGIDTATGKHIYREASTGAFAPASQLGGGNSGNNTRSRWQARLGLRVSF